MLLKTMHDSGPVQILIILHVLCVVPDNNHNYQRTNGPVDAHLLDLVKHKTWKIYGKEMTLTFNTHIPS